MKRKWIGYRRARRGARRDRAGCGQQELELRIAASTVAATSVSGTVTFDGIWTGSEATAFGDVIKAFNKMYPNVNVNYNPLGNNLPTVLCDRDHRRPSAGHGRHRAAGPREAAVAAGAPEADHVRELGDRRELRPVVAAARHVQRQAVRAVFKASNKSLLWYNVPAFKAAGVTAPKTWAQLTQGREHAQGVGHAGVLDRRRRRLDAHRPVREHLPPHVRRRRNTTP